MNPTWKKSELSIHNGIPRTLWSLKGFENANLHVYVIEREDKTWNAYVCGKTLGSSASADEAKQSAADQLLALAEEIRRTWPFISDPTK